MFIICDIDGVLSTINPVRLADIQKTPPDWTSFWTRDFWDEPNKVMVNVLKALTNLYEVVYLTGRKESVRSVTEGWLIYHCLMGRKIYGGDRTKLEMRQEGDHRPAVQMKKEVAQQYASRMGGQYSEILAIDDEPGICAMYRELGFTVWEYSDLRVKKTI
jgi:hypothetical protein